MFALRNKYKTLRAFNNVCVNGRRIAHLGTRVVCTMWVMGTVER